MKFAAAIKIAVIGALALVLLVPVLMIQGLVAERQMRRDEAVSGIAEGWGRRQTLSGPYLAVPYQVTRVDVTRETVDGKEREKRTERIEHHVKRIAAESVDWTVDAEVGEKARGIYKARLYGAKAQASGRFVLPPRFGIAEDERTRVFAPRLVFGVADPRGIRAASALSVGGASHPFRTGSGDAPFVAAGLHVPLGELGATTQVRTVDFAFSIELGGSEAFAIQPLGGDTAVTMRADWPHPSFQGQFLPLRHELGASGFSAQWKISRYAAQDREQLAVSFVEPAGLYQQLERASKYGFLFIGLTFAAFLLYELLRRLAIHPIQYALVGLALAMFFLLLTALSEHIAFAAAYAAATLACVGLVCAYLVRVLGNARAGLAFGGVLAAVYAMLYALLRAEDYSLLGGALFLFGLLAAVMLATRRVDWYALGAKPAAQTAR
jgi:inner membrane protein